MPIKNSGYSQVKNHARQLRKQREADDRQGKYELLTLAQKIALVTSRGGSKRELARLTAPPKVKPATPPVVAKPAAEVFVSDKKRKANKQSKQSKRVKQMNEALQFTGA
jgi:hypothetical protein